MNIQKLTLFILFFLSCSPALPQQAVLSSQQLALNMLWQGISNSDVKLVKKALDQGADVSAREQYFGDTALMAAIRKYGSLILKKNALLQQRSRSETTTEISLAVLMGGAVHYWQRDFGFTIVAMLAASLVYRCLPSWPYTSPATQIAILLIQANPDLQARNKEGLTALEILNSYFSFAYQFQDNDWYIIQYLLFKKASTT